MPEPLQPLITLVGDTDADMCGPDGCLIPSNETESPANPQASVDPALVTPSQMSIQD